MKFELPPTVTEVHPEVGWANAETLLLVKGTNFKEGAKARVKAVTVGGRECGFVVTSSKTLLAVVAKWGEVPPGQNSVLRVHSLLRSRC